MLVPDLLNTDITALIIVYELSCPSCRSKPRIPVLRPAVQWIDWMMSQCFPEKLKTLVQLLKKQGLGST